MDRWTVYVEVEGKEVWSETYGDIGSAQMAAEGKRLDYSHHAKALIHVEVGIRQE